MLCFWLGLETTKGAKMCDDWAEDDGVWDDQLEVYAYEDDLDSDLEDEQETEATGPCPECGVEIDTEAEMCAACGYWLTTGDRHTLWDGGSSVRGAMSAGKVALVVLLIILMSGLVLL